MLHCIHHSNVTGKSMKMYKKLNTRCRCFVSVASLLCCILSSFLCAHLPQSLLYDLYRPLHSHPSWPLLHTDGRAAGVSEGGHCQVVFEKHSASFLSMQRQDRWDEGHHLTGFKE